MSKSKEQHTLQKARAKRCAYIHPHHGPTLFEGNVQTLTLSKRTVHPKGISTNPPNRRWSDKREDIHAPLERMYPAHLETLENGGGCNKSFWSQYMVSQMMNNSNLHDFVDLDFGKSMRSNVLGQLEQDAKKWTNLSTVEIEEIRRDVTQRVQTREMLTLAVAPQLPKRLFDRPWTVHVEKLPSFIVADNQMLRDALNPYESFYFTLSSTVCIGIHPPIPYVNPTYPYVRPQHYRAEFDWPYHYFYQGRLKDIDQINARVAFRANKYAYAFASAPLERAFAIIDAAPKQPQLVF